MKSGPWPQRRPSCSFLVLAFGIHWGGIRGVLL